MSHGGTTHTNNICCLHFVRPTKLPFYGELENPGLQVPYGKTTSVATHINGAQFCGFVYCRCSAVGRFVWMMTVESCPMDFMEPELDHIVVWFVG